MFLKATILAFLLVGLAAAAAYERKPYPPCDKCDCVGIGCKGRFPAEAAVEWPDLVGVDETIARVTIEQTNSYVTVVTINDYEKCPYMGDRCCNRVVLCVQYHPTNNVTNVPMVG
ncbi:unnamed protein product [Cuscuta europaea]|uniref:Uncharacterized protein n=1 Tax=Cuscuta europaea TaxID=41803 RepID=A0A9P1E4R7_CUSEU|nr:unnamed protein product [Cuscuta europaea]